MSGYEEVRDYDTLIAAFRTRLAELDITHATLDRISGLPTGYAGKLLGEAQVRTLGRLAFDLLAQSLALKFIPVIDEEAVKRMAPLWEKRNRADYNAVRTASIGKRVVNRMLPVIAAEMQKRGRITYRTKTKPSTRRRVARIAARARWRAKRPR